MFKFKARKKTGQAEEVEEKDLMMEEITLTEKENQILNGLSFSDMYLEGPCQISMMERFAKIVNGQKLSVTFQKNFIIDV